MSEKKMRAVVLEKPTRGEDMILSPFPIPETKPGWVLVRVKAFGMNHSEQILREFEIESDYIQKPIIPGIECVDGSSAVTLTLTQTGNTGTEAGVWADDFELVEAFTPDTETELVKNGGFESLNNWTSIPTTNGSSWIGRTYKEAHWAFGYDPSGGSQFCSMHRFGGVMQDVTLPYPGRYRMSYRSKGRISWADFNGGTYRPFPTRAYLVKDGVTNVLGRSSHQSTNYVQNVFDFTAKKAGVYTLAIQGLWSSAYPSGAEAHVDDVSLRALPGTFDRSPPFDKDMRISVAEGAFLRLDFEGTNRVNRVRLGGQGAVGVIDAASYPEFICGDGALEALAHGTLLLFR